MYFLSAWTDPDLGSWHAIDMFTARQLWVVTRQGPADLLQLRQMETYGVQMKGVLPWLVRWARRAVIRDFYPALAAHRINFHSVSPSPSNLGRQSRRVAFLLICVSGCNQGAVDMESGDIGEPVPVCHAWSKWWLVVYFSFIKAAWNAMSSHLGMLLPSARHPMEVPST